LFQMKVTPAVVVHIDFGGDNHSDPNLAGEVLGHQSGIATLSKMNDALIAANLQDQVTFAMMNVFGRTMQAKDVANGRQHNDAHHVSLLIGSGVKSSVVGGVYQTEAGKEYRANDIDSATGKGMKGADVPFSETFGAMGKTLAAAVGLPAATIDANVLTGKVIKSALV
jgi:hypothetical protein